MLDINLANAQAEALRSKINELNVAKSQLSSYKCDINNAWHSAEVTNINRSIDAAISKVDQQIREINNIANDIKTQAAQIRAAQEAEARRQAEIRAKQQARARAKAAAKAELEELDKKVQEAERKFDELSKIYAKKSTKANKEAFEKALKELNDYIDSYNKAVEQYNSL